ncbi:helix-turn-helix transcriptional regulator [Paeniglutamicibacter kerguelensis]|uniref:DNA-binding NarL/FixJ family response regulator n=1 Tax=Paeniglutamicibacter kerguelensis TaxID=254788 RepID=A0ABS4X8Z5_9MICC|nr:helix-turn-helix transcriptional regulator [Paeniglutamicibacter kerguelensis]MBP2384940.1 DNA-binding NarL/FixJ family response regulator [Paeniglutamicibacter kerguelensis]
MTEDYAWRPNFGGKANANGEKYVEKSLGGNPREIYLDELKTLLREDSATALVMLGGHGDDRVALLALAQGQVAEDNELIYVVGTAYAQRLNYGALAFLLTDIGPNDSIGPADVIRSISKMARPAGCRPVVVVQFPQLLDAQSRAVLSQMAYSRSILLVILAAHAEFLPAEFVPLCGGPGYHEVNVDPFTVGEAHQALIDEFGVVPTPVATAEMWRRSQGCPGWLEALAHDAVASGKLAVRDGHLILEHGPWPHGARVESMALSQLSILSDAERRLVQRLAAAGSMTISPLKESELADVDHLIGWGFVERIGNNREAIRLSSRLLEDVLRSEMHVEPSNQNSSTGSDEGNFFDFISGHPNGYRELAGSENTRAFDLCRLLDGLRSSLLDGELEDAEQAIHRILPEYLEELPAELFEVIAVAQAILHVIADRFHQAEPVLDSMYAQLEDSEATYDLWLIRSMRNFIQDIGDPSRHTSLPFTEHWDSARWWFTELLASPETTAGRDLQITDELHENVSQRELLELIVGLRHGYQFHNRLSDHKVDCASSRSGTALTLMASVSERDLESKLLAGLEAMIDAGLVVFALPRANGALEKLSPSGQSLVASWVNRRRKSNTSHSKAAREEFLEGESPLLEVLTRREKFVATAAAQGLNNQQIAKDAGVSIRTVEGHLYQIYSKLAIGGRRELSTMVASLEIGSGVKV